MAASHSFLQLLFFPSSLPQLTQCLVSHFPNVGGKRTTALSFPHLQPGRHSSPHWVGVCSREGGEGKNRCPCPLHTGLSRGHCWAPMQVAGPLSPSHKCPAVWLTCQALRTETKPEKKLRQQSVAVIWKGRGASGQWPPQEAEVGRGVAWPSQSWGSPGPGHQGTLSRPSLPEVYQVHK